MLKILNFIVFLRLIFMFQYSYIYIYIYTVSIRIQRRISRKLEKFLCNFWISLRNFYCGASISIQWPIPDTNQFYKCRVGDQEFFREGWSPCPTLSKALVNYSTHFDIRYTNIIYCRAGLSVRFDLKSQTFGSFKG